MVLESLSSDETVHPRTFNEDLFLPTLMGTCFLQAPEGMQPFLSLSIHEKSHDDEPEV